MPVAGKPAHKKNREDSHKPAGDGGDEDQDVIPKPLQLSFSGLRCQMLQQAGHQFDQIARPVAAVELPAENVVPGVTAGAGRAGKREQIGAMRQPAGGAALDGRGADLA